MASRNWRNADVNEAQYTLSCWRKLHDNGVRRITGAIAFACGLSEASLAGVAALMLQQARGELWAQARVTNVGPGLPAGC